LCSDFDELERDRRLYIEQRTREIRHELFDALVNAHADNDINGAKFCDSDCRICRSAMLNELFKDAKGVKWPSGAIITFDKTVSDSSSATHIHFEINTHRKLMLPKLARRVRKYVASVEQMTPTALIIGGVFWAFIGAGSAVAFWLVFLLFQLVCIAMEDFLDN